MRKVLNTIWTRAENGQNPSQKTLSRYLWNPQKHSFGPREIWPWNSASESLEQQNTSPKASNSKTRCKTVAKSSPRTPLPKASNSKTQAVAVDAKSPKHHLDTSRKRPKPEPKNCFTLPLESTKTIFWASRNLAWNTASESREQQNTGPKASNSKTQAVALEAKSPKHHLDTSRKRPKPDPKNPVAKSGLRTPLPKASNSKTQAVALDAKSPKHHLDTSRKRPKPEPKNSFTLPLESTKTLFCASRNLALEQRFRKPRTAKHKPESLEQQNTLQNCREI